MLNEIFGRAFSISERRQKRIKEAVLRCEVAIVLQNQRMANMHPHSVWDGQPLVSSFDLDAVASGAVEGRNKQLEFYRKRGMARW